MTLKFQNVFSKLRGYISHRFLNTSATVRTELTCRDALNSALDEEMARDERVYIIGEDIGLYEGPYKVTRGLYKKYGDKRVIDSPITEMGYAGLAHGSSVFGLRPVCEFMMMAFSLQAMDQIVNSSGRTFYMTGGSVSVPIVFRGVDGSAVGTAAQHSHTLGSSYANISGLKILAPYSAEDCRGLLKTAIRDNDPIMFMENEFIYNLKFEVSEETMKEDFLIPIGKAKIERQGNDVTMVSFSKSLHWCLEATKELSKSKIECELINLRTLKPMDYETIFKSVAKTHRLVTVEEAMPMCGMGAEVIAAVMENDVFFHLDAPAVRLTSADVPCPYSRILEEASQPRTIDIVRAVRTLLNR